MKKEKFDKEKIEEAARIITEIFNQFKNYRYEPQAEQNIRKLAAELKKVLNKKSPAA